MRIYSILLLFLVLSNCRGPEKPSTLPIIEEAKMKTREELAKDLQASEWNIRSAALLDISQNQYKEFLPTIRNLLKQDSNSAVKATAALTLADFQDKKSTPDIILLLKDPNISKDTILDALARMKDISAESSVIPFLDSDVHVLRLQAVEALVSFGDSKSSTIVLQMALKNKDSEKAKTYAMYFGKLKVTTAESYLLNLSESKEHSPTVAASILALGRIKSKKAIPRLIKWIESDYDKGRENSVLALKEIADVKGNLTLVEKLKNPNREIQSAVAEVLSSLYNLEIAERVHDILKTKEPNILAPTAFILGRFRFEKSRSDLEEALKNQKNPDRELLAQSLGWIQNKNSIPILNSVLVENSGEGRYGAAWSLGMLNATESLEQLMQSANSSDSKLSRISIESLGMIGSEKSLEFLNKKVSSQKEMSPVILSSIANIKTEAASLVLSKYLFSKEKILQQSALQAILQRKDPLHIEPLIQLLQENNDAEINSSIILSLKSITGEKYKSKNEWINRFTKTGK